VFNNIDGAITMTTAAQKRYNECLVDFRTELQYFTRYLNCRKDAYELALEHRQSITVIVVEVMSAFDRLVAVYQPVKSSVKAKPTKNAQAQREGAPHSPKGKHTRVRPIELGAAGCRRDRADASRS
jgi:AICAR transformylase/IMP cyclohydrolase PurH